MEETAQERKRRLARERKRNERARLQSGREERLASLRRTATQRRQTENATERDERLSRLRQRARMRVQQETILQKEQRLLASRVSSYSLHLKKLYIGMQLAVAQHRQLECPADRGTRLATMRVLYYAISCYIWCKINFVQDTAVHRREQETPAHRESRLTTMRVCSTIGVL